MQLNDVNLEDETFLAAILDQSLLELNLIYHFRVTFLHGVDLGIYSVSQYS